MGRLQHIRLFEAFAEAIVAYHVSEYDFDRFDLNNTNIGNSATILDAHYFLDDTQEAARNFGNDGYMYQVDIRPKHLLKFDLRDENIQGHEFLTPLEFQEAFAEQLVGYDNLLSPYLESQGLSAKDVDCVELAGLNYSSESIEYIVLDDDIIEIISKTKL